MTAARDISVDRLHGRVRVGVLAVWLGSWALFLLLGALVSALMFSSQPALFWLIWSLVTLWISQYPSRWAESRLADRWPSGRKLTLTDEALTLTQPASVITLNRQEPIARLTWCFKIQRQRGTRVPAGYYCLAVRYSQGAAEIVMYGFASAAESAALRADHGFYELVSSRDRALKEPARGRGRDTAYLTAEASRYEHGGEISFSDLSDLVQAMATGPKA